MSSLLSGSPLSFPPSAITAIVPSLETHGTKQWTPSCCQWLTSSTVKRRIVNGSSRLTVWPLRTRLPMPEAASSGGSGRRKPTERAATKWRGVSSPTGVSSRHMRLRIQRVDHDRTRRSLSRCRSRSVFSSRANATRARR